MFGFVTFGPVDYTVDYDDLPRWSDDAFHWVWPRWIGVPAFGSEGTPAEPAESSKYSTGLRRPEAASGYSGHGWVWSSLVAEIEDGSAA